MANGTVANYNNIAYGLTQALLNVFPTPIIAKRDPTGNDKAQLGTLWVNKNDNGAFVLTSVLNNSSNWENISGGGGTFSSLTVTPGPINLTGTTNINVGASNSDTTIGNISGTGNTSLLGAITDIDASTEVFVGGLVAPNISIGNTANALSIVSATTDIESATTINTISGFSTIIGTGGTGTVEIGNATGNTVITGTLGVSETVTIADGNLIISTATTGIHLPGPTKIITGSGAPASGLAAEAGDLYINTTASTTTTRLYIATGAGAWTFFTTNA